MRDLGWETILTPWVSRDPRGKGFELGFALFELLKLIFCNYFVSLLKTG
jgi:hypothetical protein